jgi:hypothetical protein
MLKKSDFTGNPQERSDDQLDPSRQRPCFFCADEYQFFVHEDDMAFTSALPTGELGSGKSTATGLKLANAILREWSGKQRRSGRGRKTGL